MKLILIDVKFQPKGSGSLIILLQIEINSQEHKAENQATS